MVERDGFIIVGTAWQSTTVPRLTVRMLLPVENRERLDKFLAQQLPEFSRTKLTKQIEKGLVTVDGEIERSSFIVEPGMVVEISDVPNEPAHDLTPANIPLEIAYEDEDVIVVNKPRGLATHPAVSLKEPSLVNALLGMQVQLSGVGEAYRPGIVHRLDKETTGLLIVAKTDAAHANLAAQIEAKSADRRYFAVASGVIEKDKFTIDAAMERDPKNRLKMCVRPDGRRAKTHVRRIAWIDSGTLVAIRLETGRTHQIRVHFEAIGHAVLGDTIYSKPPLSEGPLQLHAGFVAFNHPRTGDRTEVFCAPPEDFYGRDRCTPEAITQ